MTEYVAGFFFLENGKKVALIEKKRPEWQAGKLNGIGGHIEPKELPEEAMAREFEEETGFKSYPLDWRLFTSLEGLNFKVYFFFMYGSQEDMDELKSTTDEEIKIVDIKDIDVFNAIPNLTWLIPMAKSMSFDRAESFKIQEEC